MQIKRREFLKATLAAGAATAFGGPVLNAFANGADHKIGTGSTAAGKWMPSTCEGCTTWCAIEIFVQDGRAVKVRGNQRSKIEPRSCVPRGHLILQQMYDPDRVKVPMKRTNPKKGRDRGPELRSHLVGRGDGYHRRQDVGAAAENEAHKFVLFRGRYTYLNDFLYDAMPKIFGSPNNISHSSLCAEAEKFGWLLHRGLLGLSRLRPGEDQVRQLIWGADPVASNRQVPNAIRRLGRYSRPGHTVADGPPAQHRGGQGPRVAAGQAGRGRGAGGGHGPRHLDRGPLEPRVRGRFHGRQEPFRGRRRPSTRPPSRRSYTNGLVKWWNLEIKDRTPEWAEKVSLHAQAEQIGRVADGFCQGGAECDLVAVPGVAHAATGRLFRHGGPRPERPGRLGRQQGRNVRWEPSSMPTAQRRQVRAVPGRDRGQGGLKHKKIDQRGTKAFPAMASRAPGCGVVTNRVADAMLAARTPTRSRWSSATGTTSTSPPPARPRWEKALEKLPFLRRTSPPTPRR